MNVLLALVWCLAGVVVSWAVISFRAAADLARAREQMRREIRAWQEETQRYKARADRLAREKESWVAGIKQGRDDVITMVPLLLAAQQRLTGLGRNPETGQIDDCA
jgi:hypothetical protein